MISILLGVYIGIALAVMIFVFLAEMTCNNLPFWKVIVEAILVGALWPILIFTVFL